jgi:hypothetical protein
MNLRKPLPPFPLWAFLIILIILVLIVMSSSGCATTCEPTIIKVPVEVEVLVPIPPEPLMIPARPALEACDGDAQHRVKCIRRNIERLRDYASKLLDEIEAHNGAIQ